MRRAVLGLLAVLCIVGCGDSNVVQPGNGLPTTLIVSGTVWKPLGVSDSVAASGAAVYEWPQNGTVYTDSLGRYSLLISAVTDSSEIVGFMPDSATGGHYARSNRIAIPDDHGDVRLNFKLEYMSQNP